MKKNSQKNQICCEKVFTLPPRWYNGYSLSVHPDYMYPVDGHEKAMFYAQI